MGVVEAVAQWAEGLLPARRRDVQALARLRVAAGGEDVHVDAAAALAVLDRGPRVAVRLEPGPGRLLELVEDGLDLRADPVPRAMNLMCIAGLSADTRELVERLRSVHLRKGAGATPAARPRARPGRGKPGDRRGRAAPPRQPHVAHGVSWLPPST